MFNSSGHGEESLLDLRAFEAPAQLIGIEIGIEYCYGYSIASTLDGDGLLRGMGSRGREVYI